MARADVVECVRLANDKYLHWDKFRRHPLPEGISAEVAWHAVFMSRNSQQQKLPLSFSETTKLWYVLPPRHLEWLHDIDKQAGGTIGLGHDAGFTDDDERYLFNSLMEEAIASSQLEVQAQLARSPKRCSGQNANLKTKRSK